MKVWVYIKGPGSHVRGSVRRTRPDSPEEVQLLMFEVCVKRSILLSRKFQGGFRITAKNVLRGGRNVLCGGRNVLRGERLEERSPTEGQRRAML